LRGNIDEILIDNEDSFRLVQDFLKEVMPHFLPKAKLYQDAVPLFNRYRLNLKLKWLMAEKFPCLQAVQLSLIILKH